MPTEQQLPIENLCYQLEQGEQMAISATVTGYVIMVPPKGTWVGHVHFTVLQARELARLLLHYAEVAEQIKKVQ